MKKIKIDYILIIIGLIGGLFSGFNFKDKQQEKLHIQFHYKGNIARTVDLPKYDYGYIEHQSVKQLKDGVLKDPDVAARIGELIIKYHYGLENYNYPIKIRLYGKKIWLIQDNLPQNMLGGGATLILLRSNSMIIDIAHSK